MKNFFVDCRLWNRDQSREIIIKEGRVFDGRHLSGILLEINEIFILRLNKWIRC